MEGELKQEGKGRTTPHVRNIVAENIESQVSTDIPQPKVTARRKQDEGLARLIEDMLRNELDRLPMEYLNDMQERTVPIQGGSFFHVPPATSAACLKLLFLPYDVLPFFDKI